MFRFRIRLRRVLPFFVGALAFAIYGAVFDGAGDNGSLVDTPAEAFQAPPAAGGTPRSG